MTEGNVIDSQNPLENSEAWKQRLAKIEDYVKDFLSSTANSQAFFSYDTEASISEYGWADVSESGQSLDRILEDYDDRVVKRGINPTAGNFMGYVPGGGVPDAAIGDFLAAITNRYAGVFRASPGAVDIENALIRWFCRELALPDPSWGTLTSGGTTASIVALVAARSVLDFDEWGRAVIYFSRETHHCLQRSLIVTGMHHAKQRMIPVNEDRRIDVKALRKMIADDRSQGYRPWVIVGNAGTVNTGAVDPLDDLAVIAEDERMWFHVDAAYGGGFAFLESMKPTFAGIESAHSIVLDPHKGFFQPYGLGAVLVADGKRLKEELSYTADYLRDVEEERVSSPADYSLELTRHFRGLRLWMTLKIHGTKEVQKLQAEKLELARYLHSELEGVAGVELGPDPQLSIVTFKFKGMNDEGQLHALSQIIAKGHHLSSTKLKNTTFLRVCILNFRSHREHVDSLLSIITEMSQKSVSGEGKP